MLVKTPSGVFLLLFLASCLLFLSSPGADARRSLARMSPLLVLVAVYSLVAINQNLNIGHRHMLPVYPPLYVLCGLCGKMLRGSSGAGAPRARALLLLLVVVAAAAIAVAAEVLTSFPYFIAFFNRLSGGPQQGFRHLVDSSLDWGQVGASWKRLQLNLCCTRVFPLSRCSWRKRQRRSAQTRAARTNRSSTCPTSDSVSSASSSPLVCYPVLLLLLFSRLPLSSLSSRH
eukprot:765615-Hanusia_phi.AAC.2